MKKRFPLVRTPAATTLGLAALAGPAAAQDVGAFPSRPLKLMVPFPPGGASDAVARLVGQHLSALWKQPVVIDNKPSAGTAIGIEPVARAPGDGHTVVRASEAKVD